MKKTDARIWIVVAIIISMLMVAAPAFAANPSCTEVPGHGWHIVGGGQDSNHWYETEAACLADLDITEEGPTDVPTESPTATDEPTQEPTETPDPTDEPTQEPTQTPVVTPTAEWTPIPTDYIPNWPPATPDVSATKRVRTCETVWEDYIVNTVHKEVGYRYFDKREQCQRWLMAKHDIDYDVYKIMYPLVP